MNQENLAVEIIERLKNVEDRLKRPQQGPVCEKSDEQEVYYLINAVRSTIPANRTEPNIHRQQLTRILVKLCTRNPGFIEKLFDFFMQIILTDHCYNALLIGKTVFMFGCKTRLSEANIDMLLTVVLKIFKEFPAILFDAEHVVFVSEILAYLPQFIHFSKVNKPELSLVLFNLMQELMNATALFSNEVLAVELVMFIFRGIKFLNEFGLAEQRLKIPDFCLFVINFCPNVSLSVKKEILQGVSVLCIGQREIFAHFIGILLKREMFFDNDELKLHSLHFGVEILLHHRDKISQDILKIIFDKVAEILAEFELNYFIDDSGAENYRILLSSMAKLVEIIGTTNLKHIDKANTCAKMIQLFLRTFQHIFDCLKSSLFTIENDYCCIHYQEKYVKAIRISDKSFKKSLFLEKNRIDRFLVNPDIDNQEYTFHDTYNLPFACLKAQTTKEQIDYIDPSFFWTNDDLWIDRKINFDKCFKTILSSKILFMNILKLLKTTLSVKLNSKDGMVIENVSNHDLCVFSDIFTLLTQLSALKIFNNDFQLITTGFTVFSCLNDTNMQYLLRYEIKDLFDRYFVQTMVHTNYEEISCDIVWINAIKNYVSAESDCEKFSNNLETPDRPSNISPQVLSQNSTLIDLDVSKFSSQRVSDHSTTARQREQSLPYTFPTHSDRSEPKEHTVQLDFIDDNKVADCSTIIKKPNSDGSKVDLLKDYNDNSDFTEKLTEAVAYKILHTDPDNLFVVENNTQSCFHKDFCCCDHQMPISILKPAVSGLDSKNQANAQKLPCLPIVNFRVPLPGFIPRWDSCNCSRCLVRKYFKSHTAGLDSFLRILLNHKALTSQILNFFLDKICKFCEHESEGFSLASQKCLDYNNNLNFLAYDAIDVLKKEDPITFEESDRIEFDKIEKFLTSSKDVRFEMSSKAHVFDKILEKILTFMPVITQNSLNSSIRCQEALLDVLLTPNDKLFHFYSYLRRFINTPTLTNFHTMIAKNIIYIGQMLVKMFYMHPEITIFPELIFGLAAISKNIFDLKKSLVDVICKGLSYSHLQNSCINFVSEMIDILGREAFLDVFGKKLPDLINLLVQIVKKSNDKTDSTLQLIYKINCDLALNDLKVATKSSDSEVSIVLQSEDVEINADDIIRRCICVILGDFVEDPSTDGIASQFAIIDYRAVKKPLNVKKAVSHRRHAKFCNQYENTGRIQNHNFYDLSQIFENNHETAKTLEIRSLSYNESFETDFSYLPSNYALSDDCQCLYDEESYHSFLILSDYLKKMLQDGCKTSQNQHMGFTYTNTIHTKQLVYDTMIAVLNCLEKSFKHLVVDFLISISGKIDVKSPFYNEIRNAIHESCDLIKKNSDLSELFFDFDSIHYFTELLYYKKIKMRATAISGLSFIFSEPFYSKFIAPLAHGQNEIHEEKMRSANQNSKNVNSVLFVIKVLKALVYYLNNGPSCEYSILEKIITRISIFTEAVKYKVPSIFSGLTTAHIGSRSIFDLTEMSDCKTLMLPFDQITLGLLKEILGKNKTTHDLFKKHMVYHAKTRNISIAEAIEPHLELVNTFVSENIVKNKIIDLRYIAGLNFLLKYASKYLEQYAQDILSILSKIEARITQKSDLAEINAFIRFVLIRKHPVDFSNHLTSDHIESVVNLLCKMSCDYVNVESAELLRSIHRFTLIPAENPKSHNNTSVHNQTTQEIKINASSPSLTPIIQKHDTRPCTTTADGIQHPNFNLSTDSPSLIKRTRVSSTELTSNGRNPNFIDKDIQPSFFSIHDKTNIFTTFKSSLGLTCEQMILVKFRPTLKLLFTDSIDTAALKRLEMFTKIFNTTNLQTYDRLLALVMNSENCEYAVKILANLKRIPDRFISESLPYFCIYQLDFVSLCRIFLNNVRTISILLNRSHDPLFCRLILRMMETSKEFAIIMELFILSNTQSHIKRFIRKIAKYVGISASSTEEILNLYTHFEIANLHEILEKLFVTTDKHLEFLGICKKTLTLKDVINVKSIDYKIILRASVFINNENLVNMLSSHTLVSITKHEFLTTFKKLESDNHVLDNFFQSKIMFIHYNTDSLLSSIHEKLSDTSIIKILKNLLFIYQGHEKSQKRQYCDHLGICESSYSIQNFGFSYIFNSLSALGTVFGDNGLPITRVFDLIINSKNCSDINDDSKHKDIFLTLEKMCFERSNDIKSLIIQLFTVLKISSDVALDQAKKMIAEENEHQNKVMKYLCLIEPDESYLQPLFYTHYEHFECTVYSINNILKSMNFIKFKSLFAERSSLLPEKRLFNASLSTKSSVHIFANAVKCVFDEISKPRDEIETILQFFLRNQLYFRSHLNVIYPILTKNPYLVSETIFYDIYDTMLKMINPQRPQYLKIGRSLLHIFYRRHYSSFVISESNPSIAIKKNLVSDLTTIIDHISQKQSDVALTSADASKVNNIHSKNLSGLSMSLVEEEKGQIQRKLEICADPENSINQFNKDCKQITKTAYFALLTCTLYLKSPETPRNNVIDVHLDQRHFPFKETGVYNSNALKIYQQEILKGLCRLLTRTYVDILVNKHDTQNQGFRSNLKSLNCFVDHRKYLSMILDKLYPHIIYDLTDFIVPKNCQDFSVGVIQTLYRNASQRISDANVNEFLIKSCDIGTLIQIVQHNIAQKTNPLCVFAISRHLIKLKSLISKVSVSKAVYSPRVQNQYSENTNELRNKAPGKSDDTDRRLETTNDLNKDSNGTKFDKTSEHTLFDPDLMKETQKKDSSINLVPLVSTSQVSSCQAKDMNNSTLFCDTTEKIQKRSSIPYIDETSQEKLENDICVLPTSLVENFSKINTESCLNKSVEVDKSLQLSNQNDTDVKNTLFAQTKKCSQSYSNQDLTSLQEDEITNTLETYACDFPNSIHFCLTDSCLLNLVTTSAHFLLSICPVLCANLIEEFSSNIVNQSVFHLIMSLIDRNLGFDFALFSDKISQKDNQMSFFLKSHKKPINRTCCSGNISRTCHKISNYMQNNIYRRDVLLNECHLKVSELFLDVFSSMGISQIHNNNIQCTPKPLYTHNTIRNPTDISNNSTSIFPRFVSSCKKLSSAATFFLNHAFHSGNKKSYLGFDNCYNRNDVFYWLRLIKFFRTHESDRIFLQDAYMQGMFHDDELIRKIFYSFFGSAISSDSFSRLRYLLNYNWSTFRKDYITAFLAIFLHKPLIFNVAKDPSKSSYFSASTYKHTENFDLNASLDIILCSEPYLQNKDDLDFFYIQKQSQEFAPYKNKQSRCDESLECAENIAISALTSVFLAFEINQIKQVLHDSFKFIDKNDNTGFVVKAWHRYYKILKRTATFLKSRENLKKAQKNDKMLNKFANNLTPTLLENQFENIKLINIYDTDEEKRQIIAQLDTFVKTDCDLFTDTFVWPTSATMNSNQISELLEAINKAFLEVKYLNVADKTNTFYEISEIILPKYNIYQKINEEKLYYGSLKRFIPPQICDFMLDKKYCDAQEYIESKRGDFSENDEVLHLLEVEWVKCAKRLQQWDVLTELGTLVDDPEFSADVNFNAVYEKDMKVVKNILADSKNTTEKRYMDIFLKKIEIEESISKEGIKTVLSSKNSRVASQFNNFAQSNIFQGGSHMTNSKDFATASNSGFTNNLDSKNAFQTQQLRKNTFAGKPSLPGNSGIMDLNTVVSNNISGPQSLYYSKNDPNSSQTPMPHMLEDTRSDQNTGDTPRQKRFEESDAAKVQNFAHLRSHDILIQNSKQSIQNASLLRRDHKLQKKYAPNSPYLNGTSSTFNDLQKSNSVNKNVKNPFPPIEQPTSSLDAPSFPYNFSQQNRQGSHLDAAKKPNMHKQLDNTGRGFTLGNSQQASAFGMDSGDRGIQPSMINDSNYVIPIISPKTNVQRVTAEILGKNRNINMQSASSNTPSESKNSSFNVKELSSFQQENTSYNTYNQINAFSSSNRYPVENTSQIPNSDPSFALFDFEVNTLKAEYLTILKKHGPCNKKTIQILIMIRIIDCMRSQLRSCDEEVYNVLKIIESDDFDMSLQKLNFLSEFSPFKAETGLDFAKKLIDLNLNMEALFHLHRFSLLPNLAPISLFNKISLEVQAYENLGHLYHAFDAINTTNLNIFISPNKAQLLKQKAVLASKLLKVPEKCEEMYPIVENLDIDDLFATAVKLYASHDIWYEWGSYLDNKLNDFTNQHDFQSSTLNKNHHTSERVESGSEKRTKNTSDSISQSCQSMSQIFDNFPQDLRKLSISAFSALLQVTTSPDIRLAQKSILKLLKFFYMHDNDMIQEFDECSEFFNVQTFIFFIPQIIEILNSGSFVFSEKILDILLKRFPQSVFLQLKIELDRRENIEMLKSVCGLPFDHNDEKTLLTDAQTCFSSLKIESNSNVQCKIQPIISKLLSNLNLTNVTAIYKLSQTCESIVDALKSTTEENLYRMSSALFNQSINAIFKKDNHSTAELSNIVVRIANLLKMSQVNRIYIEEFSRDFFGAIQTVTDATVNIDNNLSNIPDHSDVLSGPTDNPQDIVGDISAQKSSISAVPGEICEHLNSRKISFVSHDQSQYLVAHKNKFSLFDFTLLARKWVLIIESLLRNVDYKVSLGNIHILNDLGKYNSGKIIMFGFYNELRQDYDSCDYIESFIPATCYTWVNGKLIKRLEIRGTSGRTYCYGFGCPISSIYKKESRYIQCSQFLAFQTKQNINLHSYANINHRARLIRIKEGFEFLDDVLNTYKIGASSADAALIFKYLKYLNLNESQNIQSNQTDVLDNQNIDSSKDASHDCPDPNLIHENRYVITKRGKLNAYMKVKQMVRPDILANHIENTVDTVFTFKNLFANTFAQKSFMMYLFGICDRTPSRVAFSKNTADIYNLDVFPSSKTHNNKVRYRLTPNICEFLGDDHLAGTIRQVPKEIASKIIKCEFLRDVEKVFFQNLDFFGQSKLILEERLKDTIENIDKHINESMNPQNLAKMCPLWHPWF